MSETNRTKFNETGQRLYKQVLFGMSGGASADYEAFEFTSLRDYVTIAQWWAAQSKQPALALIEDDAERISYRIDLGDGGILMRTSGDIVRALRETNPDLFGDGLLHASGSIDLQAALHRLGDIEESSKQVAPRRSA
jgi:hypothetical protein